MSVITAEPMTETQANGTKAPEAGQVREAIAEQLARDERQIAELQQVNAGLVSRIVVLEKNQKPTAEKKPVTDSELDKAIASLEGENAASLKTASPKLDLSLSGKLGFIPLLSGPQKTAWAAKRDAMRNAHTKAWKELSATAIAHLKRAVRKPDAVMGGSIVSRKSDGAVNAVSLRARGLAPKTATKGKGKNGAKPANPVARMPKAPNANPPATVK